MKNEKEYILNELMEHTRDCDCCKSQHFFDGRVYRKKAGIFNTLKSVVFLCTIASYVILVSEVIPDAIPKFIMPTVGFVLTLVSTLLEILSYMLRYDDKAMEHWKAAQVYSEIYRECQFFCTNNADAPLEVWREKLGCVSSELCRIAALSPSPSDESYDDWKKEGLNKKYPVHKAIKDLKVVDIDKVVEAIKDNLKEYKIEIFLFGSYFTSMHYNDVDIAVILHEDENEFPLKERMNKIEQEYSINGVDLDITIITEADIIANRCTQFVKNISEGECYYKSPDVKKSLVKAYSGTITNYNEMVTYFMEQAVLSKDNYINFVENVFYMHYHALTALLAYWRVNWYGEKSMISQCELLATQENKMEVLGFTGDEFLKLLLHTRLFMDEKNSVNHTSNIDKHNMGELVKYFEEDQGQIKKLMNYLSEE